MAMPQEPSFLEQVRHPRNLAEQVIALRALKNSLVGHAQKKEEWIRRGALDVVMEVLALSPPSKADTGGGALHPLTEEDMAKLLSLQVVASFANGGPSYLKPLSEVRALPAILQHISPQSNSSKVVTAALRTLCGIAEAAEFLECSFEEEAAGSARSIDLPALADGLFLEERSRLALNHILEAPRANLELADQANLICKLICILCREERHQLALADDLVLDRLAALFASIAVAQGQVVPVGRFGFASSGRIIDDRPATPEPAPHRLDYATVIRAVATITADSKYRTFRLLWSDAISSVFSTAIFTPSRVAKSPWTALENHGLFPARFQRGAMDYLLPAVPSYQLRSPASSFWPTVIDSQSFGRPAIARLGSGLALWDSSRPEPGIVFEPTGTPSESDLDEADTPLLPWLVHQIRTRSSNDEKVAAAWMLTSLFKPGAGRRKFRETAIGSLLVVPVLVDIIKDFNVAALIADSSSAVMNAATGRAWARLANTTSVLAKLMTDNDALQKAGFDCGLIKLLSRILKASIDTPYKTTLPGFWSPKLSQEAFVRLPSPAAQKLGPRNQTPLVTYLSKVREGVLRAICAICAGKEDYRKAVAEEELVPYIIACLSSAPKKPNKYEGKANADATDDPVDMSPHGEKNPVPVIVAACHAIRTLSRSVGIMRTQLTDNDVGVPIFRHLRHTSIDVQVAATAAMCNLVVKTSPLRDSLSYLGVVPVLCEHARSANASLRLNALWALKHFIDEVGPDVKKACLGELQPGWLIQLICNDGIDNYVPPSAERGKSKPSRDLDDDVDMGQADDDHSNKTWVSTAESNGQADGTAAAAAASAEREPRVVALRDAEFNAAKRARNDDLAVQEQALDFIRNVINISSAAAFMNDTAEMVDFVFNEIGSERLLDILHSKLQPKPPLPMAALRSGLFAPSIAAPASALAIDPATIGRAYIPQARIAISVMYILVHIAASSCRHKQLLMAHPRLLSSAAQLTSSADSGVRVTPCHLAINLTSDESPADEPERAQRALELRKLGFAERIERLLNDPEPTIKEQATLALHHLRRQGGY